MGKEGERYDWLDPFRAGMDEVTAYTVGRECICDWSLRPIEGHGTVWVLAGRERECPMHGMEGLF